MASRPAFIKLKNGYPNMLRPCRRYAAFNQCAIRMSLALVAADPNFLANFKGSICPVHKEARSASQLAAYLAKTIGPPQRWYRRGRTAAIDQAYKVIDKKGVKGIIYYDLPSTNHIDLWSGDGGLKGWYKNKKTMGWWDQHKICKEIRFWKLA